jgi:hypothetical protein
VRRLRHPIRAIREPFGTAGLIIAMVALVAALGGSAVAASSALSGKQKKEVEKIAKKFAGKPGTPGTTGPAGAAGAAGKNGTDGSNGVGTNGTGATTTSFTGTKGSCTNGGIEVKSASPTVNVCNGTNGTSGFTETLPSGKTETGAWSISAKGETELEPGLFVPAGLTSISFPIPLELALPAAKVVFLKPGETAAGKCEGEVATPEAEPGFLCVYTKSLSGMKDGGALGISPIWSPALQEGEAGASTSGANITLLPGTAEAEIAYGAWAVTAE